MTWKDTTPRSQQNPTAAATCWTLYTGKVRISVLNSHRCEPGEWVMHCHQVGFDCKRIGVERDTSVVLAKVAALEMVRKELRAMLESLEG